jgi:hypothetical protein
VAVVPSFFVASTASQQTFAQSHPEPTTMVQTMVEREREAEARKPSFTYTSVERSDRTGGREWTEHVIEVPEGKLRYLILEDGKPLSPDRRRREDSRLRSIANDPGPFIRQEHNRKGEEQHAQELLDLLPRAFLFDDCGNEQGWEQIKYRPNPSYLPQSYEERILRQMSGTILIDPDNNRLHMLNGVLAEDVSFGYGLLATLRAGSKFLIVRNVTVAGIWKTTQIDVRMDGHVVLFKTISRRQASVHRDFKLLPSKLTIAQAVALLVR